MKVLFIILVTSISAYASVISDDKLYIGKPRSSGDKALHLGRDHVIKTRQASGSGSSAVESGIEYCFVENCIDLSGPAEEIGSLSSTVDTNKASAAANAATIDTATTTTSMFHLSSINMPSYDNCKFSIQNEDIDEDTFYFPAPDRSCPSNYPQGRSPVLSGVALAFIPTTPIYGIGLYYLGRTNITPIPRGQYYIRFRAQGFIRRTGDERTFASSVEAFTGSLQPSYGVGKGVHSFKVRLASTPFLGIRKGAVIRQNTEACHITALSDDPNVSYFVPRRVGGFRVGERTVSDFAGYGHYDTKRSFNIDCDFYVNSLGNFTGLFVQITSSKMNSKLEASIDLSYNGYSFDIYTIGVTPQQQLIPLRGS